MVARRYGFSLKRAPVQNAAIRVAAITFVSSPVVVLAFVFAFVAVSASALVAWLSISIFVAVR